jgi:hypothetical protein
MEKNPLYAVAIKPTEQEKKQQYFGLDSAYLDMIRLSMY